MTQPAHRPVDHDLGTVIELEERLARRRGAGLEKLIAAEFLEFGRSGKVWCRDDIVGALDAPAPAALELAGVEARFVGDEIVHCTYQSIGPRGRTLRSSLWVKRQGEWRIVFHQGTPVPDEGSGP